MTDLVADMQRLSIQSHARGRPKGNVRTLARMVHCFPLLSVRMQKHISGQMLAELPWPFRTPGIASVLPCNTPEQIHACMWATTRLTILSGKSELEALKGAHDFIPISMKSGVLDEASRDRYYKSTFIFPQINEMAQHYRALCHKHNIGDPDEICY